MKNNNLKKIQDNNVMGMQDPRHKKLQDCKPASTSPRDTYIVRNLIEKGLIMLYGGTGTGKTMLTEWLCYQLTRADIRQPGRQHLFLGRLCYPCEVYYYTLETVPDILYNRAQKYPGRTSSKFNIVDYSNGEVTDVQWLADMEDIARDHVLSRKKEHLVFVLDPLSNLVFTGVDSINSPEMIRFLTKVMNFTHNPKFGCPTVILLHHINKAGSFLGSTTIGNVVNGTIEISRLSEDRVNLHFWKMRATALPPDMILQRNEDLTYTLVEGMDLDNVEDLQDRKNLVKIINYAYNQLLVDRANEAKLAVEEEREPNNITSATILTKTTRELPNTIDTLVACEINDIIPNNFYKFLDKYRQNLADNGVTVELDTSPNRDDRIKITYTDNTSTTILPTTPAPIEEVPEEEFEKTEKPEKEEKKVEPPVALAEEDNTTDIDNDEFWGSFDGEPPANNKELSLEDMYDLAGSSEEDVLKAYEEYCKEWGDPNDWYNDIPEEEQERIDSRSSRTAELIKKEEKEQQEAMDNDDHTDIDDYYDDQQ